MLTLQPNIVDIFSKSILHCVFLGGKKQIFQAKKNGFFLKKITLRLEPFHILLYVWYKIQPIFLHSRLNFLKVPKYFQTLPGLTI